MRQEDKEVDGPDLEKAEDRKRESELVEEKEDELYDLDGLPETTVDSKRSTEVLEMMKQILEGDRIVLDDSKLPKRQVVALEALKTAVEGKDQQLSTFVYAEDRRTLLEQALAVLQPEIASMQGAGKPFEEMIAKVGELREKLNVLEDSEEELVEGRAKDSVEDQSDSDDKPDEDESEGDGESDDDVADDAAALAKKAKAKAKGKDKDQGKGGKAKPTPTAKETADEDQSLTGPERPMPDKGPTTLGDPKEIAKVAEREPRWRRSDG